MASVEGATGADRAMGPAAVSASPSDSSVPAHTPRTVLAQTHSNVCARRVAHRPHSGVSGRRHQQLGHRGRQADHSRYSNTDQSLPPPHPRRRTVIACLVITAALGLLYLAVIELFHWDTNPELVWFGLLIIVFGGAVIENAIRFDGLTTDTRTHRRTGWSAVEEPTMTPGLPA